MNSAFGKLWESIKRAYFELGSLVILNLLWLVFSVTLLLLPAATSALYYAVREMQAGEVDYSHKLFFKGLKLYLIKSWRWFLPNLILIPLFLINLFYFVVENNTLTVLVKASNLALLLLWLWLQIFLLPLLMEQEVQSVRLALRNALVIFLKKPGIYGVTVLFVSVFMIISLILMMPWIVITFSFSAFIQIAMLRFALAEMKDAETREE
jgi:hypothetical protein